MQLVYKIQFKRVRYSLLTLIKFSVSLKRGYLGYMVGYKEKQEDRYRPIYSNRYQASDLQPQSFEVCSYLS